MWLNRIFVATILLPWIVLGEEESNGSCIPPVLENGLVDGKGNGGHQWVGRFSCKATFSLVGEKRAKCMNGIWSSDPPVCVALGQCSRKDLPKVKFARLVSITKFRGAVVRYSCRKGYRRYGQGRVYCNRNKWSIAHPPICARSGCDEESVSSLRYGHVKASEDGAVYRFHCEEGAELLGAATIWCNGAAWNDTAPICQKVASDPVLSVEVNGGETQIVDGSVRLAEGDKLTVTCSEKVGYPHSDVDLHLSGEKVAEGTTQASFTVVADRKLLRKELVCTAGNSIMPANLETSATLYVEYPSDGISTLTGATVGLGGKTATYDCMASPGYPVPELHWIVFSEQTQQFYEATSIEAGVNNHPDGSMAPWSTLQLQLPTDSNQIHVQCSLDAGAVPQKQEAIQSIQTDIQSVAGSPLLVVNGEDQPDTPLIAGEEVRVECRSNGGFPAPSLTLAIDGVVLVSENSGDILHLFVVSALHNGANLECSAINSLMPESVSTTLQLNVLYGPADVEISGPESVVWGEEVEFSCTARPSNPDLPPSNPPTHLQWTTIKTVKGLESTDQTSEESSVVNESTLRLTVEKGTEALEVVCSGASHVSSLQTTIQPTVLYGPEKVEIEGPEEAKWGEEVEFKCHALSVNPALPPSNPPTVIAWKTTKTVAGMESVEIHEGDEDTLVMTVDEGTETLEITCTGTNQVSSVDMVKHVTITVALAEEIQAAADAVAEEIEIEINNLQAQPEINADFEEYENKLRYEVQEVETELPPESELEIESSEEYGEYLNEDDAVEDNSEGVGSSNEDEYYDEYEEEGEYIYRDEKENEVEIDDFKDGQGVYEDIDNEDYLENEYKDEHDNKNAENKEYADENIPPESIAGSISEVVTNEYLEHQNEELDLSSDLYGEDNSVVTEKYLAEEMFEQQNAAPESHASPEAEAYGDVEQTVLEDIEASIEPNLSQKTKQGPISEPKVFSSSAKLSSKVSRSSADNAKISAVSLILLLCLCGKMI